MYAIDLRNVSYIREDRAILDHVSWQVEKGEKWVLLGLNGSGKTTLLNLINGYIFPSEGEATILGCRFGQVPIRELRKDIGWVSSALNERIPQRQTAMHIVLSGIFATVGLWDDVTRSDEEHAYRVLADLHIAHLHDHPYGTLSQGEKQRVLIARALYQNPALLVFDEPFTGLDIFARRDLENALTALSETNRTMLLVSHNTADIPPDFDAACLLRQGKVFSQGPLHEVINTHSLQGFYGADVRVEKKDARYYLYLND